MASTLQSWYHRIFEQTPPKGLLRHLAYQAAGVMAFTAYISFEVWLFDEVRPAGGRGLIFLLTFVLAVLFWWWSAYMLLYRRLPLRRLFPAGLATGLVRSGILFKACKNLGARCFDAARVLAPGSREIFEDCRKAGPAAAVVGRRIGSSEEWFAIGREKNRHGPAAAAGGGLNVKHIDAVDVGALLAVDLYRDEMVVEELGDRGILERLAFHHVAPVAGRVADREKNGFVFAGGFGEGFIAPGIPIDGVLGVLQEIGALFVRETIGHGGSLIVSRRSL